MFNKVLVIGFRRFFKIHAQKRSEGYNNKQKSALQERERKEKKTYQTRQKSFDGKRGWTPNASTAVRIQLSVTKRSL